jgi:hypothetical protein
MIKRRKDSKVRIIEREINRETDNKEMDNVGRDWEETSRDIKERNNREE